MRTILLFFLAAFAPRIYAVDEELFEVLSRKCNSGFDENSVLSEVDRSMAIYLLEKCDQDYCLSEFLKGGGRIGMRLGERVSDDGRQGEVSRLLVFVGNDGQWVREYGIIGECVHSLGITVGDFKKKVDEWIRK